MYHPEVVARRLDVLNRHPDVRAVLPEGLQAYPVEECHAYVKKLKHALSPKGQLTRELSREESIFVANEQFYAKSDFAYWAERYASINKAGATFGPMFPLWESQRLILDEIGRIEHEHWIGKHPDGILVNVLKARQLGASTLSESLLCHRATTWAYTQGLVASDEPESSAKMFRIFTRMTEELPWFLRPVITDDVKNTEMGFGNGSRTEMDAGKSNRGTEGQRGQIGRSGTYSVLHLTELSSWERASQIDSALLPALFIAPRTLALFESTAKGRHNWWHEHWLTAKSSRTRFTNIFIPWYAEHSRYWLPYPSSWKPSTSTLIHAEKCIATSPFYFHGQTIRPTKEQLYWYECEREIKTAKGELAEFLEEYPADDVEAFQMSGHSVFPLDVRMRIEEQQRPLLAKIDLLPHGELHKLKQRRKQEAAAEEKVGMGV